MQPGSFNFTRDVVERLARERPADEALRAVGPDGSVRSFTFDEVAAESAAAAAGLARLEPRPGDVVMTLMGARPEWVLRCSARGGWAPSRCRAPSSCAPRT